MSNSHFRESNLIFSDLGETPKPQEPKQNVAMVIELEPPKKAKPAPFEKQHVSKESFDRQLPRVSKRSSQENSEQRLQSALPSLHKAPKEFKSRLPQMTERAYGAKLQNIDGIIQRLQAAQIKGISHIEELTNTVESLMEQVEAKKGRNPLPRIAKKKFEKIEAPVELEKKPKRPLVKPIKQEEKKSVEKKVATPFVEKEAAVYPKRKLTEIKRSFSTQSFSETPLPTTSTLPPLKKSLANIKKPSEASLKYDESADQTMSDPVSLNKRKVVPAVRSRKTAVEEPKSEEPETLFNNPIAQSESRNPTTNFDDTPIRPMKRTTKPNQEMSEYPAPIAAASEERSRPKSNQSARDPIEEPIKKKTSLSSLLRRVEKKTAKTLPKMNLSPEVKEKVCAELLAISSFLDEEGERIRRETVLG